MQLFFVIIISFFSLTSVAQSGPKKLYNPQANAVEEIKAAVKKAAVENKFVLIQAGGNWCGWCIEFERFCNADFQIDSIIKSSFVVYHLNYSKENRNEALFSAYDFPQRLGFPVLIVLNTKGDRIHTEDSELLEDGKKSYDRKKVLDFLGYWSPRELSNGTLSKQ